MAAATPLALQFLDVRRRFGPPVGGRMVLDGVSLDVTAGTSVAIIGRSGSGKSTLLHLAAGIDQPTAGRVMVAGHDLSALGDGARTRLRRDTIGLVFQFFHLLPHLSVRDNVALPALIAGDPAPSCHVRTTELLTRVGLADRADDPVQRLSGGEQQRVAICRALLRRPRLILADEPTGNLDDVAAQTVMDLLLTLARAEQSALVLVTHSAEMAARADSVRRLHHGVLEPA